MTNEELQPQRSDYEAAFRSYVSRVEQAGGRVFNVEQDARTGLYTWAAMIPDVERDEMDRRLGECDADLHPVEVGYARWALGVTPEPLS